MSEDSQTSGTVMMVRPASFGFHAEAAASNAFASAAPTRAAALREFDGLAEALEPRGRRGHRARRFRRPGQARRDLPQQLGVVPRRRDDGPLSDGDGSPAARAQKRRADRATGGQRFRGAAGGRPQLHERHGHFLEGTGSLILDRPRRRAYANRSPRTDAQVIADFDDRLDFSTLLFDAHDRSGRPIYHTNVLLSLGTSFAILCMEAVAPEFAHALIARIRGRRTNPDRGRLRPDAAIRLQRARAARTRAVRSSRCRRLPGGASGPTSYGRSKASASLSRPTSRPSRRSAAAASAA